MSQTPPPDGRATKWILLLTLIIALAARLAAGQETSANGTGTREITVRLGRLEAAWPEAADQK